MNKNKMKGALDEMAGRTKRQVGEWTGNDAAQVKGATQEIKGKIEKAAGSAQEAIQDASNKSSRPHTATKRP